MTHHFAEKEIEMYSCLFFWSVSYYNLHIHTPQAYVTKRWHLLEIHMCSWIVCVILLEGKGMT